MRTPGIHHVTAIAGDAQRTLDFYAGVLGLRLVKRTVNFDDPSTYHLYFGDRTGRPGTLLTFFPWGQAPRGRRGAGQVATVALRAPPGSLSYWLHRLESCGVAFDPPRERFGEQVVPFRDPDGLALELVVGDGGEADPWPGSPVPTEHALRGVAGVALAVEGFEHTAETLTDVLGFEADGESCGRHRFAPKDDGETADDDGAANGSATVDVEPAPAAPGRVGVGTVHHVAFRGDDPDAWRERVVDAGFDATPVIDRRYFRSVYFREPGGVLFEIATDGPGFTVDEPAASLGSALRVPEWLAGDRHVIEAGLPPLRLSEPAP